MANSSHLSEPPETKAAEPCAIVIFGAAGDLTKRLVIPALYNLARCQLLPEEFTMIGVDAADLSTGAWREGLSTAMQSFISGGEEFEADRIDGNVWSGLFRRATYLRGDFESDATFERLAATLGDDAGSHRTGGNVLFYLAVADGFFGPLADRIAAAGLADEYEGARWRRVIVEKPFGHSLESARALNTRLLKAFSEDQIYRIDHFLGKETVQSIMAVRFANGSFEPIWNRDHIDHVQITVAETVGVERRGQFYEHTGALRDMVPNHLFQLLTMMAMEPPASFDPEAVRDRKVDVLRAISPIKPTAAVRGQYGHGAMTGVATRDYRSEPDVSTDSPIETYAALRLEVDTWRWAGVPFYLRTGKRMPRRWTEIAICFRRAPLSIFEDARIERMPPNWLVLQIQPEEGISFQFQVKRPGQALSLASVKTRFAYKDWFPPMRNVGYETLIYDCMIGDASLFQRADMVEAGWRIVQPVLDAWSSESPKDFPNYAAGSAGPIASDSLLGNDGRDWRRIDRDA